jgi:hypothetical protein
LLFLPNEKESVQALRSDLVTSDGINVDWKIKHGFDLEDPNIAPKTMTVMVLATRKNSTKVRIQMIRLAAHPSG